MKLAVLGTGFIITDALNAISEVPEIEKVALFARPNSKAKGEEFARNYDIERVYTDYEELLSAGDIDTIYVGLVNSVHYEYTKQALLAGKDVILEKPFTTTLEETKDLAKLARENGRFLFEAITNRHSKVYEKMQQELPRIGRIRLAMGNYSQYSSRYERYKQKDVAPAFDPLAFGGALNDLGIYNLSLSVSLLGKPKAVRYDANIGFNGVDTSGVATLRYKDYICTLSIAKDCDGPCYFTIEGEDGYLRIPGKPNEAEQLDIFIRGEGASTYAPEPDKNRMVQEFRDFAQMQAAEDFERMSKELDTTVTVMETLMDIRAHMHGTDIA
ncbi:MAG: Gfo/Idh/MocA family oxidoreductase [Lachnospiraceae bacterium]|nr:Gfo/Idh/MocA family oxidoreductase [Lachnospiraceae bacterium]